MNTNALTFNSAQRPITRWTVYRGLLWREWRLFHPHLFWFLSTWLIGIFILRIFDTPPWVGLFAGVFALYLSPSSGGSDISEGSEEFAFALPVSRAEHYLARMVFGLFWVAFFCLPGLALVVYDVPGTLWSWFVESGFTESTKIEGDVLRLIIQASIVGAFSIYGVIFSNAALCRSGRSVNGAVFTGLVLIGIVTLVSQFLLPKYLHKSGFTLSLFNLTALSIAELAGGFWGYVRKEASLRTSDEAARWSVLRIIAIAFLLYITLGFLASLVMMYVTAQYGQMK